MSAHPSLPSASPIGPRAVVLAAAGAALGLGACLPHDVQQNPAPPTEVPDRFAAGETAGGEAAGEGDVDDGQGGESGPDASAEEAAPLVDPGVAWWTTFGDPQLAHLVRIGLRNNLDLRAAWARLDQARALAVQAGAPRFPSVDLELRGGRQRQFIPGIGTFDNDVFSASLPISYELDLFRRIGAQAAAAELDARASREDLETLAITLSANIAEAWYDLLAARARSDLLEQQLDANEAFLELTVLRFSQGLVSAVDVHQQRAVVASTQGLLAQVVSQEAEATHRLASLLGDAPGTPVGTDRSDLPELPPVPRSGLPSDLLVHRPDLRAARYRVEAADWRVGSAIAGRFPSIRLTGSVGFSATDIADLFQQVIWNVFANIGQSIIDGGQQSAEVDLRRAQLEESIENYGAALLTALVEVENALVQERQQIAFLEAQEDRAESSRNALRESRVRYQQGLTDYLTVLTALTNAQNADLDFIAARRQRISFRIQLHRALGGTWTRELPMPLPRRMGGGVAAPPVDDDGELGGARTGDGAPDNG